MITAYRQFDPNLRENGRRFWVAYLFSRPAILTRKNCRTIKMRNISQQIVNNDSPDFSNNHHAIVAPNITPIVTRPRLHKMISAAENGN
jgi:hypothetical protein